MGKALTERYATVRKRLLEAVPGGAPRAIGTMGQASGVEFTDATIGRILNAFVVYATRPDGTQHEVASYYFQDDKARAKRHAWWNATITLKSLRQTLGLKEGRGGIVETLFTEGERQTLLDEAKRVQPNGKSKKRRGSSSGWRSINYVDIPKARIEHHVATIAPLLAKGIAKLIYDVAVGKDITGDYRLSYDYVKRFMEKDIPPRLRKLLQDGDPADMTDYQGRGGEFDRRVTGAAVTALFQPLKTKYKGFSPLSIMVRMKKMDRLPARHEVRDLSHEVDALVKKARKSSVTEAKMLKASKGFRELAVALQTRLAKMGHKSRLEVKRWGVLLQGDPWIVTIEGTPSKAVLKVDPSPGEMAMPRKIALGNIMLYQSDKSIDMTVFKQLKHLFQTDPYLSKG